MLRGGLLVVIATCVALAAARRSPQADSTEKWLKSIETRYSDDVFEDALLDVVSCEVTVSKLNSIRNYLHLVFRYLLLSIISARFDQKVSLSC